ncbi:hypothetical protein, partial [Leptospira ellisii]|uniref:hypothetical protein n=1 Tax=Leptospira ellisii TaxID=2023197 RepID=UPI000CAD843E
IAYANFEIADSLSDNEKKMFEQSQNFIYVKKAFQGESLFIEPGSFTYFIVEALSEHTEFNIDFGPRNPGGYCNSNYFIDNYLKDKATIISLGTSIAGNVNGTNSPCYYEIRTNVAIPSLTVTATGATNLSLSVFAEKDTSLVEYSLQNGNATKTLNNIPVSANSRRLIKVDGLNAGSCPISDPTGCPFTLTVN